MPQLGAYWFDEIGIAEARTRARFHNWVDLEVIELVVQKVGNTQPNYVVAFSFTRIRQLTVATKRDFWGRLGLGELAAVLDLAVRHGPATLEISPKAKFVREWAGLADA